MVDAEFAVQYLVLAHADTEPVLTENIGNIGLLRRAQALGLVPVGIGDAAALAYRTLRHQQHRARLDEQTPNGTGPEAEVARAAVTALWQAVFERPRYDPATAQ
jgi:glutamate-ammonia-ligase adenylyltransferase